MPEDDLELTPEELALLAEDVDDNEVEVVIDEAPPEPAAPKRRGPRKPAEEAVGPAVSTPLVPGDDPGVIPSQWETDDRWHMTPMQSRS